MRKYLSNELVPDLYREDMTMKEAEDAVRRDPRVLARHVRKYLSNELVPDLYREDMTMKEAEDAVRRDPRVLARHVRKYLSNELVPDLYREDMTTKEAEDAVRRDPRVLARHVRKYLSNELVPDLYREDMTMKEAEDAVRRDPRVLARHATFGSRQQLVAPRVEQPDGNVVEHVWHATLGPRVVGTPEECERSANRFRAAVDLLHDRLSLEEAVAMSDEQHRRKLSETVRELKEAEREQPDGNVVEHCATFRPRQYRVEQPDGSVVDYVGDPGDEQLFRVKRPSGRVEFYNGKRGKEVLVRTRQPSGNMEIYEGKRGKERLVRINHTNGTVERYKGEKGEERLMRVTRRGGETVARVLGTHKASENVEGAMSMDQLQIALAQAEGDVTTSGRGWSVGSVCAFKAILDMPRHARARASARSRDRREGSFGFSQHLVLARLWRVFFSWIESARRQVDPALFAHTHTTNTRRIFYVTNDTLPYAVLEVLRARDPKIVLCSVSIAKPSPMSRSSSSLSSCRRAGFPRRAPLVSFDFVVASPRKASSAHEQQRRQQNKQNGKMHKHDAIAKIARQTRMSPPSCVSAQSSIAADSTDVFAVTDCSILYTESPAWPIRRIPLAPGIHNNPSPSRRSYAASVARFFAQYSAYVMFLNSTPLVLVTSRKRLIGVTANGIAGKHKSPAGRSTVTPSPDVSVCPIPASTLGAAR